MNPEEHPISRGRQLFDVMKKIRKHNNHFKPDATMRPSEMMMLHNIMHWINQQNESNAELVGVTISELSICTDQTPSSVSQIVKSLEEKGLVERKVSSTDRRIVYITLSEYGRQIMDENMRAMTDRIGKLIDALGEEDADQLITLLEKLSNLLEAMDKSKDSV